MDYHHGAVIVTAFFLKTFSLVAGDAQTHYLLNSNGTCVNSPLEIDLWGTGTSSVKLKLSQNQTALNTNGTNGTVCKMLWDEQLGTRTLLKLTFIQNDTCDDRLEIAVHNRSSKEYNLCPPNGTDGVTFLDFNGSMIMTYYAGVNTSNRWRFEALLTQYIFLPRNFPCPVPFIRCDTNRCVSNYLQLDGDPNCEDGTDEVEPTTTSSSTTPSTLASTTVSPATSTTVSPATSTTVSPSTSTTASLTSSVTSSATSSVTSSASASTAPSASLSTTASSAMSTTELSASSSTISPPASTAASSAITIIGWITPSTNNTATSIARFMAGLSGTQFMSAMLVPVALIICTVSSVVCLRRRKRSYHYENTLDS